MTEDGLPEVGDAAIVRHVGSMQFTIAAEKVGRWSVNPGGFTLRRHPDTYELVWRPGPEGKIISATKDDWNELLILGLPTA